jgi:basic membrane protein A
VKLKRWMPWVVVAVAALSLALVAGASASKAKPTSTHAKAASIKVGLVTDIGGLNDRGFNHLAYLGLQQAQSKLGVTGQVAESKSAADYIPNLSNFAQQGYQLVIAVGFLMADAVDAVATRFPNTKFAIIDYDATTLKDKPSNVQGILFKEQEAGYLAGYLAGLEVKAQHKKGVFGSVGGLKIPPVDRYIAGYQAGVKKAFPGAKVVNGYSQDFVDQAKCKEVALNQIAQGAQVVFQVAGGCGLGVLDAAKQKKVWGIGVDSDQSFVGPQVLTSALKKVDRGVYLTISNAANGSFRGGGNVVYGVRNDGTGVGTIAKTVPASIRAQVAAIAKQLRTGKLKGLPTTVS